MQFRLQSLVYTDSLRVAFTSQSSIFGAAKPREAILASREGKREEDILKEDVKKEKVHVRPQNLLLTLETDRSDLEKRHILTTVRCWFLAATA